MTRCDVCGAEIAVGEWPFCPHGKSRSVVIPDDVPGGFWAENGFTTPRQFFSRSAHRAALAAENMEQRVRWAGPHDQHVTRWDTVDLDSAREALERQAEVIRARNARTRLAPITVAEGDTFRETDLDG